MTVSVVSASVLPQRRVRHRRPADDLLPRYVKVPLIVLFAVVIIAPLLYLVMLSLTPDNEIGAGQIVPSHWDFSHYVFMWSAVPLARGLLNSLLIGGSASLISVFIGLGAAYVLARFTFRGRRSYLMSLVGLQTIPGVMILLPLYVVFAWVQTKLNVTIVGTYPAIILTYLTFALPFGTWLEFSYLASIPVDFEEAALVDGASRLGALRRVVLPLMLPGMAVALIFDFLGAWNDVLFASALTNTNTQTLAVAVEAFSYAQAGAALPHYGELMAAAVLSAVPVVVVYMLLQRYLVSGLTAGGVKA